MLLFLDRKIVNYMYKYMIEHNLDIKEINNIYINISIKLIFILLSLANLILNKGNYGINLVLFIICLKTINRNNILIHFFYTMHLVLQHKKDRQIELNAITNEYIELQNNNFVFIIDQYKMDLEKEQVDFKALKEKLNQFKQDNLPFFIKDNFNFSKSFFKFYINKMNQVRNDNIFIICSLLIPNRKELSPEELMLILNNINYEQSFNEDLILQIKHIILDYKKNKELFKRFSNNHIKRLFRRKINLNNFFRLIYLLDKKEELNTELLSIEDIITSKEKQLLDYDLEKIKNNEKYIFKICQKYEDFEKVKKHFKNCILTYIEQPFDIVAVYENTTNRPLACFSIKNKRIVEIKGPENLELPIEFRETINLYIQKCFHNKESI